MVDGVGKVLSFQAKGGVPDVVDTHLPPLPPQKVSRVKLNSRLVGPHFHPPTAPAVVNSGFVFWSLLVSFWFYDTDKHMLFGYY